MSFADALAADTAALFTGEFAVDAVYTQKSDRTETEVVVIFEPASVRQMMSDRRPQSSPTRLTAQMLVQKSQISAPAYQDTVEIDAVTWTVLKTLWEDGGILCVEVDRDMRAKF